MSPQAIVRALVIVSAVAVLELLCDARIISAFTIVAPSQMVKTLVELFVAGKVTSDLAFTFSNTACAIVISVVVGFAIGALLHFLPRLRRVLDPLLAAYYAVPTFVFYPLLVVLMGVNRFPLIAIGAMFGVVGMTISTMDGMDRIPRALTQTARIYRMGPVRSTFLIKLPAAAPYLMTGVKLAATYSLIGVVAGEFILSTQGLGRDVAFAYNDLSNRTMYAYLLLILLIAIALNMILTSLERRMHETWGQR